MRLKGVLVVVGIVLLGFVVLTFATGMITALPLPVLVVGAVGAAAVVIGLLSTEETDTARVFDPVRSRRRGSVISIALGAMGAVALVVALTVAEGEAQGHAVSHWVVGLPALVLFGVLALRWHPQPGTGASAIRIGVLAMLTVGAFGSFLESLGGAGYDAANLEPRIAPLAALHGVALPFAALGLPALAVGTLVAVVVLVASGRRRSPDVTG